MPTSADQRQDERISAIERKTDVIDQKLVAMQDILETLKEVVVDLNDAMRQIVRVQERQTALEDKLTSMRRDFDDRAKRTDPIIDRGQEFMNRWKGGVKVAIFFLAVLQAVAGFYIVGSMERLDRLEAQDQVMQRKIDNVQREVQTHEVRDFENKSGPEPFHIE